MPLPVQWAAVRISLLLMRLPPQNGVLSEELEISPTCHGYSLASVFTPPTILETRLAWPHLQEVRGGAVVVTGAWVVVVTGGGRI